jgi:exosortase
MNAWLLTALLVWVWAWRHLSIEWLSNDQYGYGLGVPVLFLLLAWRRWSGPMEPRKGGVVYALAAAGWVAFALGELLRWHDPIWRATGGLLAAGATLATVAALLRRGGGPLVRREMMPLVFAWTAVPWPVPLELALTQNLLHGVTSFTVVTLGLTGIPALQHGNAIELSAGMLGIDDACSGIRSLQAALMAAVFLGEYFRLGAARRAGLIAAGAALALGFNAGRVLALALVYNAQGAAAEGRVHDLAGGMETACIFLAILGVGLVCRGKAHASEKETGAMLIGRRWERGGVAVFCAFALAPVLAWGWFGHSTTTEAATPRWTMYFNRRNGDWQAVQVNPRPGERSGLRFDTWEGCQMWTPEGWSAEVIHIGWARGHSMPSLAFYHTPELCMPWVGWRETGVPGKLDVPVHGTKVPCMAYRFEQDGQGIFVLQSLSAGGRNGYHVIDPHHMEDRWHRLRTLWQAPMKQVDEELLVYLPDFGSAEEETKAASEVLEAVVQ